MTSHIVALAAEAAYDVPGGWAAGATGYRRWDVVTEAGGSVHTGFNLGLLDPGGTVPAVALLQRELGAETVTMAFSLAGSRAHAPNEWHRVYDFERGPRVYAAYLSTLAELDLKQR